MKNIFTKALALGSLMCVSAGAFAADAPLSKPLLMEGKQTLYQRVLTTPGCDLYSDANFKGSGKEVSPFTQYYVYEDLKDGYHVGVNATGKLAGYVKKDCTVPWKQQLAMLFTNPANRDRALIFNSEENLDKIIDSDQGSTEYAKLEKDVADGKQTDEVISIEPKEYVDYQKNFYLLPILQSNESMFPDGAYVYKHEIASITDQAAKNNSDSVKGNDKAQNADDNASVVGFKSAVVFVIDSSISMQPYIDRTKQAINTIYKSIEASHLNDSVQFGIVSFRADVRKAPGLEYTAKMYLKPGEATNAAEFNKKVSTLTQAKVSSAQFDEDSYAGINLALQDINWNNYGGRYIVLITDAGAIDGDDKQSSTGLDARALHLEAEHYGAAIYTLHLLTKAGAKDHKRAQSQYETLSFNQVLNKPLYYQVNAGSVNAFGEMVDQLARSLTEQVRLAAQGELSAGSSLSSTQDTKSKDENKAIDNDSKKLGLAMQLAYLGRLKGTQSPTFMKGWIADRDIIDHNKVVATPVVLVNRNQLSDLYTLVKGVLESGIAGQLSSDDMFSQLQALAAQMGRDPNQLDKSKTISQMGIMGELLDDLPYKSRIASLSPDDWYNLGSQEQESIVRGLENSLNYIQHCASDNDRFIKLNQDADESEEVYPIPLDALP